MERLFRKEREEEEHPLLCLEEPKREVETIREPDLLKKVLQVLELNAGKLARSVLRGESRGNATLLPDVLAAIRDCQLRQQLLSLKDPQYKHHGQAITFRFKKDCQKKNHKGWRLFATTDVSPPPTLSRQGNGCLAVDINSDHLAVVETDRFGNLLHTHALPLVLHDLSKDQARARIGDVSAHSISLYEKAKKTPCPRRPRPPKEKSQLARTKHLLFPKE